MAFMGNCKECPKSACAIQRPVDNYGPALRVGQALEKIAHCHNVTISDNSVRAFGVDGELPGLDGVGKCDGVATKEGNNLAIHHLLDGVNQVTFHSQVLDRGRDAAVNQRMDNRDGKISNTLDKIFSHVLNSLTPEPSSSR